MKEDLSIAETQESEEIPPLLPGKKNTRFYVTFAKIQEQLGIQPLPSKPDPPPPFELDRLSSEKKDMKEYFFLQEKPKEIRPLSPGEKKDTTEELTSKSEDNFGHCLVAEFVSKQVIFNGIQDSYQIQEKLGRGGNGSVYRVQPSKNKDVQYAMKVVSDEDGIQMEKEVLNKAKSLHSIHLSQIYDSGIDNLHSFMIIDLLGLDLHQFRVQDYSYKSWLKICEQCLTAIETLHNLGFLHRDLKPNNFVLGRKGSTKEFTVVLIDFGNSELMEGGKTPNQGTRVYGSIAGSEGKPQGPKDDLESWFYMLMESISELPWRKKGQEWNSLELKKAIRDEQTETCRKFFGNFDPKSLNNHDFYMDFARIMRLIDSLKFNEVPDYTRIHYLLQCAYRKVCIVSKKEYERKIKSRSEGRQAREEYIIKYAEKEKEIANYERFTCGPVEQLSNLAFFSSIVYDENGKYVKNIEYCGVSYISSGKKPKTKNHLRFKCYSCIDKKSCGLVIFVHYDGTEKTWDEAIIEKIKGDPNNCQRLRKMKEAYQLFVEGMKSNGK